MAALAAGSARAALFTANGSYTGDWAQASTWTNLAVPGDGDDVEITNAGASVILSSSSSNLNSLVLGRTLTFTNWETALTVSNATILSGGAITCAGPFMNGQMSNRVWLICTNLRVDAGGKILVDGCGYAGGSGIGVNGNGPGPGLGYTGGYGSGGGHGSYGGAGTARGGGAYDAAASPIRAGSGGGGGGGASTPGGHGGGSVLIRAGGTVTVNGAITANGTAGGTSYGGGGSGGSIYIDCGTFAATGGAVTAIGGDAGGTDCGAGTGGRIALFYSATAPSTLQLSAKPGSGGFVHPDAPPADIGSIYLSDGTFLTHPVTNINGQIWGVSAWALDALTVSNAWLRFPVQGFQLTVTNDVLITGTGGKLELGGDIVQGNLFRYALNSGGPGASMSVGGDMFVTNGGSFAVYSSSTNAAQPDHGAQIQVGGLLSVGPNAWIYPYAQSTNGGAAIFNVRDLTVLANGGFNADQKGYLGTYGPGAGTSVGSGYPGGGGYGGKGGAGGAGAGGNAYGSSNTPVNCGSGAGYNTANSDQPPNGGGVVRLAVTNTVIMNGTITANGETPGWYLRTDLPGGGAGGSIFITCGAFTGTNVNAILRANGGNAGSANSGGGGGGRIAVWCDISDALRARYLSGDPGGIICSTEPPPLFFGTTSVTNGTGYLYPPDPGGAYPGTCYFFTMPKASVFWIANSVKTGQF